MFQNLQQQKGEPSPSSIYAPEGQAAMDPTRMAANRSRVTFATRSSCRNPFPDAFPETDPFCKLNLRETADFVGLLPTTARTSIDDCKDLLDILSNRRWVERTEPQAPGTPGRPIFGFSCSSKGGSYPNNNHLLLPRRCFPLKWYDAEKWVAGLSNGRSSSHGSPAHSMVRTTSTWDLSRRSKHVAVSEESTTEEVASLSEVVSNIDKANNGATDIAAEIVLKDKFTDEVMTTLPKFGYWELSPEDGFLFRHSIMESMEDKATNLIHYRDKGTEMTPLGSSTNSRCHTHFKSLSPARHNTPASRSGPLGPEDTGNVGVSAIHIDQLNECHYLAKLQLGSGGDSKNYHDSVTSNWSSREEEEEEVSKSLRHFEENTNGLRKIGSQSAAAWEEEEKLKCCLRYQRDEAKIQAWLNLESANAEAQSRKLEVKIQKMRSKLEEKLMRRMAVVRRKAEARQQQVGKATEQQAKNKIANQQKHSLCFWT